VRAKAPLASRRGRRAAAPWPVAFAGLVALGCAGGAAAGEAAPAPASAGAEMPETTVRPKDTGAALDNPGMGWVFHYYDNVPANYGSRLEPSDTVDEFPGLTVLYLRIPWSYVEPEEGRFQWSVLDSPAERWIAKGRRIALRISCSESWMRWATPEWVAKAGAKGHNFTVGKGVDPNGPFWEPDYDDPVFLEKLDRFLAALGARYDGDPSVAFVDVGSFGVWGEGHTFASTRLPYSADTLKRHIDLYRKHFPRTLLAANDDFVDQGRGQGVMDYARSRGLTLRDDSILVQGGANAYFHAALAQPFWPSVPVVLESEHYGGSRDRGHWKDGGQYLQAVEEYHASYASIHWWPHEFLQENRDLVRRINLRLGYRLQLAEASWPASVRAGGAWRFAATWRNAGVAPCLPGGFPAVTLKDAKGGIAAVFADDGFDVRALPVGPPEQAEARTRRAEFALPFSLRTGVYDVCVSVGTRTGTPRIALPLEGGDGGRRYRLGAVEVVGDYAVTAGPLEKRGPGWYLPLTWTVHGHLPPNTQAFFHFDRDGRTAFQGACDPGGHSVDPEKPGTAALGCVFDVPEGARGQAFTVAIGLWVPEWIGLPDERLLPDRGGIDRRVVVGELRVSKDGEVTLVPATSPH